MILRYEQSIPPRAAEEKRLGDNRPSHGIGAPRQAVNGGVKVDDPPNEAPIAGIDILGIDIIDVGETNRPMVQSL